MTKKRKSEPEPESAAFPNLFMERVLKIRDTQPQRYASFSDALKWSARIYEEQRDRAHAA